MQNSNTAYEMIECPVSSEHYDLAVQEFFEGDQFKAIMLLSPIANYGDVFAQCLMGQYWHGKENYESALQWYWSASCEGEDRLNAYLEYAAKNFHWNYDGSSHQKIMEDIRNTLTNDQIEFLLNRKGDDKAQFNLGLMYAKGEGVDKNPREAFKWWSLSSAKGNVSAQFHLGLLFEIGEGVDKDLAKSLELYVLAAEQGHEKSKEGRSRIQSKAMTPEIREVYQKAKEGDAESQVTVAHWFSFCSDNLLRDYPFAFNSFLLAANQDQRLGHRYVGYMYQNGIGVEKNNKQAVYHFAKASKQNDVDSMIRLATILRDGDGDGVDQNVPGSIEIFELASAQGSIEADFQLGGMYLEGTVLETDFKKSFEHFDRASSGGHIVARGNLGYLYQQGLGVQKDNEKAFSLFFDAAQHGDPTAQYNLAECFEEGLGTDSDFIEAVKWYTASSNNGDLDAMYRLGKLMISGSGCEKNEQAGLDLIRTAAAEKHEDSISFLSHLESTLHKTPPKSGNKLLDDQVSYAPLVRQIYSDTTWSGESYVNEAIQGILSQIQLIAEMMPKERGEHLGASVLHLRHLLKEFNEDPTLPADSAWRENYELVCIQIDAHIAYNAVNQGVGYRLECSQAAQKVLIYAQDNRLYEVFNAAKAKGEEDPILAVGIDFIEQVVAEIID